MHNTQVDSYIDDESVTDAYVPNASGSKINVDIVGKVNISKNDMDRAWDALGIKTKADKEKAMKQLGI